MNEEPGIGITEMAHRSGLSADALRWYEREGILPSVARGPDGRRRYGKREQDLLHLLLALRDAGMTTASMKEFVALLDEGAASHGRRISLLEQTRTRLEERRRRVDHALDALEAKSLHYRELIAAGLDCDGRPVPEGQRRRQAART
jgi:DNA-binding transcriptional MerR regulator